MMKKLIRYVEKYIHLNLFNRLDPYIYKWYLKNRFEKANRRLNKQKKAQLTYEELQSVKKLWGEDYNKWKKDAYAFYKAYCNRFDINYMPNDYYNFAELVLNLRWAAYFLQHKCCFDYFIPKENLPPTILKKIDGHFLIKDREVKETEVIDLLKKQEVFVFKIARATGGGAGVKKIVLHDVENVDDYLKELLKPSDFICQQIVEQSNFMAQFNPDSCNTIRMLTLNINGKNTLLSSFIRMGSLGSFVDNLSTGGGVLVGLNKDGQMSPWGINKKYERIYEAPTGVKFEGLQIPDFQKYKEFVLRMQQQMPFANLIAWDIAISKEEEPIVIEYNLDVGEVEAHQVFNGPVFGDRTEEVMEYIATKKPTLRHAMITY